MTYFFYPVVKLFISEKPNQLPRYITLHISCINMAPQFESLIKTEPEISNKLNI